MPLSIESAGYDLARYNRLTFAANNLEAVGGTAVAQLVEVAIQNGDIALQDRLERVRADGAQ